MGFKEVERVLTHSKATGYERLALVALAHRVNDTKGDGAAWPSVETFAADVNCTDRFIQKIVKGWRESPQEVYVIDGGGRYKPNRYIILAGCSFHEVVHRLLANLNIKPAEAEQLASRIGYQKGEQVFTPATGNGEHYDTKRVNIEAAKGEHYAETVNTGSPEQELKHQLKPQITEHQLSSSSPAPANTDPTAVGEEEKIDPTPSTLEDDLLVKALAKTCGIPYPAATEKIAAELGGGAATIRQCDPDVKPSHLSYYPRYYAEANKGKPHRACPTVSYVVGYWLTFKTWLDQRLDENETRTVPGTDFQETFTCRQWLEIDDLPIGGTVTLSRFIGDWSKVDWRAKDFDYYGWTAAHTVAVELEKLPNGTFREVVALVEIAV